MTTQNAAERPQEPILAPKGRKTTPNTAGRQTRGVTRVPGGLGSELEAVLENRLERAGLPLPARQYRFCPTRRWRADFAYVAERVLIEVEGGIYSGGRHVRGKGFEGDCEKSSTAAALGFRVIRVTRTMIESGQAVDLIRQALGVQA